MTILHHMVGSFLHPHAAEAAALNHVGQLLALPLVEGLDRPLERLHEPDAELREQAVLARERLLERRVVDQAVADGAGEIGAGLLRLVAEHLLLAGIVDGRDNRLLLPRRRLEPLEDRAKKPAPRPAAVPAVSVVTVSRSTLRAMPARGGAP